MSVSRQDSKDLFFKFDLSFALSAFPFSGLIFALMNIGLPVVTSNVSCLPEAGGDAAYYVNPNSAEEIAEGMKRIFANEELPATMKEKGLQLASKFSPGKCAAAVMNVYKS